MKKKIIASLFAMFIGQVFLHALNEIALQLFFGRVILVGFQTFLADAFLAERAFFPARFRAFVTTNVNVFAWEERCDFIENIL